MANPAGCLCVSLNPNLSFFFHTFLSNLRGYMSDYRKTSRFMPIACGSDLGLRIAKHFLHIFFVCREAWRRKTWATVFFCGILKLSKITWRQKLGEMVSNVHSCVAFDLSETRNCVFDCAYQSDFRVVFNVLNKTGTKFFRIEGIAWAAN